MRNFKSFFLLYLFFFGAATLRSQTDTLESITLEFVFKQIREHHPFSQKAELLLQRGRQNLRSARGGFDPIAYSYNNQKRFKGDRYYFLSESGLKIPTWFGIEVKGNFENHDGYLLNPENTVPADGQFGLGLSVPILQGLFIDERRAVLKQAKIYAEQVQVDRVNLLNDVLLEASVAYWKWVQAYYELQIIQEGRDLAFERYEWGVETFFQGDIPAIDTLESYIQWQSREMMLLEAKAEYQNQSLKLSNFLWLDGQVPLELSEGASPPDIESLGFDINFNELFPDSFMNNLADIQPQLRTYFYKIEQLDVERRLKAEKLKPKFTAEYNALSAGPANAIEFNAADFDQNYKLGLNFSMPLFIREERGNLALAKIKLQEARLDLSQKTLEVRNKIYQSQNSFDQLIRQRGIADEQVDNYQRLLEGERVKFENGESSVFLVNSREVKYLDSRIKYTAITAKLGIETIKLYYIKGDLFLPPQN